MTMFSAIRRRWGSDRAIVAAQWDNLVYSWCIHNLKTNRFGQPHGKEKDGITFDKAPAEAIVIDGPQHGACEQPVFAHGNSRRGRSAHRNTYTPDICFKPSAYLLAVSTKNLIRMCCQINEIRIENFKTSTTGVIFEYESVAGRKYMLTVWNCFGARSTESKAIYISV